MSVKTSAKNKPAAHETRCPADTDAIKQALYGATAGMDGGAVAILAHIDRQRADEILAELVDDGVVIMQDVSHGGGPCRMYSLSPEVREAWDAAAGAETPLPEPESLTPNTPPDPVESKARELVLSAIPRVGTISVDWIRDLTGLPETTIGEHLCLLELSGIIESWPGGRYCLAVGPEESSTPAVQDKQPARLATNRADNNGEIMEIALHRIHPNPNNPRKEFDEEALSELAESIRVHGLLQPLVVMRRDDLNPGTGAQYLLIAGERRYRAIHNLHEEHAPDFARVRATVVTATDIEALEMALIENLARRDINALEQARGFRQLIDLSNAAGVHVSQREIASRIGCSQPSIANALKLLELPADVQELIGAGVLTASHGLALARFSAWPAVQSALAAYVVRARGEGRHVRASWFEGTTWEVLRLVADDHRSEGAQNAPAVYIPGNPNVREGIMAVCRDCPYSALMPGDETWQRPICTRPEHLWHLIAEEEAKREALAAEARAKLEAQRSQRGEDAPARVSALSELTREALEEEGVIPRSDPLAGEVEETPMSAVPDGESKIPTPDLPNVDELPKDTYEILFFGHGCSKECPCFRQALRGETVVDICADPAGRAKRRAAEAKAQKKADKEALAAARSTSAENIKRGDHPEVIRRAAVLLAMPAFPAHLASPSNRAAAQETGIELPVWDREESRRLNYHEQIEWMLNAFLETETEDLIRFAAMRIINAEIGDAELGYSGRAVLAAWFGRPLPETPALKVPCDSDYRAQALALDDHRARALALEVNERLREHNADLLQEILKLKGIIRRNEEGDRADILDFEEIKRQRDKLQIDFGNLTIRNRANETEAANLRAEIGAVRGAAHESGKRRVNAAKDPELQAEINRQHGEITQLKTELLAAQTEANRLLKRGIKADDTRPLYLLSGRLNIAQPAHLAHIRSVLDDLKPVLLCIDTAREGCGVRDWTDPSEVADKLRPIRSIARDYCSVMLVAHNRKADGANGDEISGTNALTSSVDGWISIKRKEIQSNGNLRLFAETDGRAGMRGDMVFEMDTSDLHFRLITDEELETARRQERETEQERRRQAVRDAIADTPGAKATVIEISDRCQLGYDTVKSLVREMLDSGDLARAGEKASGGRGRPSPVYEVIYGKTTSIPREREIIPQINPYRDPSESRLNDDEKESEL